MKRVLSQFDIQYPDILQWHLRSNFKRRHYTAFNYSQHVPSLHNLLPARCDTALHYMRCTTLYKCQFICSVCTWTEAILIADETPHSSHYEGVKRYLCFGRHCIQVFCRYKDTDRCQVKLWFHEVPIGLSYAWRGRFGLHCENQKQYLGTYLAQFYWSSISSQHHDLRSVLIHERFQVSAAVCMRFSLL
jgi:hypothetical protein